MKKVMRQAYTEVDEILKYMPKEYIERVPEKYRKLFSTCRLEDYHVNIDPNKILDEQNILYETVCIITFLKYNYWCNSDEERERMKQLMIEKDKEYANKYDIATLNNKTVTETVSHEVNKDVSCNLPTVESKTSWLSRLFSKIRRLFVKNKN